MQQQKGSLVYVPHKRKIISSYNIVFDESFSSALAYMSQPYSEAMDMRPEVLYIPFVMGLPVHLVLLGTQFQDFSGIEYKYSKLQHTSVDRHL